ncbi:MAG: ATP-binding cassette domain-containing protein [Sulfurovum sp.]|nr:ATP-binding cassette domain-containing protein [Sulfurovaceae bacterium]
MIKIDLIKTLHGANGQMDLDIKLSINKGDFIALYGKSGSGKTTLLRILAGLEEARGDIIIEDKIYKDKIWLKNNKSLAPQKRGIGFVFQDYALFPNMSIEDNLLFVKNDKNLAYKLLDITELIELRKRLPNALSGGQKQRVSLCRALMNRPTLLLMDEPLSALDPSMRTKLQNEILIIHKEFKITTIMVSHDPREIYNLASRVIVLDNGKIINDGNPKEILLQTNEGQNFTLEGELLDIILLDIIYIAIISIGQQLIKVVISSHEANHLKIGQSVRISTKAFSPTISW